MKVNKVNMFKIYFLVMKVLLLISAVFILKSQFENFYWSSLVFSSVGVLMAGIQFVALHKAEQFIEERNYLGILIGLIVSVLSLAGVMLPFGLWGIYCLLNRDFLKAYVPSDAPKWFNENILQSPLLKF